MSFMYSVGGFDALLEDAIFLYRESVFSLSQCGLSSKSSVHARRYVTSESEC